MNEHVSSLYVRAHELLNLGMDGSPIYSDHFARLNREVYERKQSFRAVLCTSIYISTFVPNLNFGQDEHKRRRQVLCLNGS